MNHNKITSTEHKLIGADDGFIDTGSKFVGTSNETVGIGDGYIGADKGNRFLVYDCRHGISGDMNIGAMLGLGVDFDYLQAELAKLGVADEYSLTCEPVLKQGIRALQFTVHLTDCAHHDHAHHEHMQDNPWTQDHAHHEHDHHTNALHVHEHHNHDRHEHGRTFRDIKHLIEQSTLSDVVKRMSIDIFQIIADAEGQVHGKPADEVHFHEVGAVDSIIDVVGAAICYEALGCPRIVSTPIALGGGFVRCAHGVLPVPAPAVSNIVAGLPVEVGGADFEQTTPTGAAIIRALATEFSDTWSGTIDATSYGAGSKDAEFPNVLRTMLCHVPSATVSPAATAHSAESSTVTDTMEHTQTVMETNLDDMTGESLAFACQIIRSAGALDVWTTPIHMKKGRTGVTLSVLCHPQDVETFKLLIFKHTTAIGVRQYNVLKTELRRDFHKVETPFGPITVKAAYLDGEAVQVKPEFDDCEQAALACGVTLEEVQRAALRAFHSCDK